MSKVVWLGSPRTGGSQLDVRNPYTSKLGGEPMLFRRCEKNTAQPFACPQCRSRKGVSLLCQLYAPAGCFDRVLYVASCAHCSASAAKTRDTEAATSSTFCFALRSQNFSLTRYERLLEDEEEGEEGEGEGGGKPSATDKGPGAAADEDAGFVFDEDDAWGDDSDKEEQHAEEGETDTLEAAEKGEVPVRPEARAAPRREESFPLCGCGEAAAVGGPRYASDGIPLDIYEEPPKPKVDYGSEAEQLENARKAIGAENVELDAFEEDDERKEDKVIRKYVSRIAQNPTQCVRWCMGGEPLRVSLGTFTVPPCPLCGGPRAFEFQLAAPSVYYLTRGSGEDTDGRDVLHYSNVFVYTCANSCYDHKLPYVREYVVMESEF